MKAYDVRRLPKEGEVLDEALTPDWLNTELNIGVETPELKLIATGNGRAKISITRFAESAFDAPTVRLSGTLEAPMQARCVRCLQEVDVPLRSELDLTLFPAEKMPADEDEDDDEELGLSDRELDEGMYQDHQIDLPEILREALLLEMDMNPVCQDEKACSTRTAELLKASGNPEEEPKIDPRWAGLKKFGLNSP